MLDPQILAANLSVIRADIRMASEMIGITAGSNAQNNAKWAEFRAKEALDDLAKAEALLDEVLKSLESENAGDPQLH